MRRRQGETYRVGFLLTVMLGNMNRYQMLRAEVTADETIEARWFPYRSWVIGDWLRFLPGWLRVRVRHLVDSARFFAAGDLDAVVVHAPELYGFYGVFHALTRRRCALIANSDASTRPQGRIGAILLRHAERRTDLFVPWSHHVAAEITGRFPAAASRLQVLHPGLPLDRWSLRDEWAEVDGRAFRLLFVGGETVRKGLITILDAVDDRLGDGYELDVVTVSRTLTAATAERVAALPNARLHLDLAPASPQLQALFRGADVLLLPSRYEMSPWVVLEALATGVPVIASDVGGIPDMVVDGRTGYLVSADDPGGLVEAVERLRRLPADERLAMVRRARAHVAEHFDARANTAKLLALIKGTVDGHEPRGRRRARTGAAVP